MSILYEDFSEALTPVTRGSFFAWARRSLHASGPRGRFAFLRDSVSPVGHVPDGLRGVLEDAVQAMRSMAADMDAATLYRIWLAADDTGRSGRSGMNG